MKTVKYTKGPWKIDKETTENGVTHVSIRAEPDYLLIGPQVCEINYHLDFKNDMGNAHLIAAAPDMFEALEIAYKRLEQLDGPRCSNAHTLGTIYNALKKARGEL